jgi:hypothetical protein
MNKIVNKISLSSIISAFILMGITLLILEQTEWHFTYTLDDPYIHLKLAQNILSGHYGLNLSEYSAPSSSILWSFLLVPFAFFDSIFEYIPLIINSVCALLSVVILDKFFKNLPTLQRTCLSILIMLTCNIYGIVFTGLEHSLQVLCVIFITYCLCYPENLQKTNKHILFFLCLFLLPLVRYEGLALSMPILLYVYIQGYKKHALMCFLAIMCVVCGFSLFLHSHDLGYLPSSISAKSSFLHGTGRSSLASIYYNATGNFKELYFLYIISFGLLLFFLKRNKYLGLVVLTSSMLHLLFGRYGWFGRYEVYQVIFIIMITLYVLLKIENPKFRFCGVFLIIFILFKSNLLPYTFNTPLGSSNIYHQQVQMARITQMLDDKVALNDIGLVSLRSKHEILDVFGLASIQALKYRLENPTNFDWINILLKEKNIKFIMIYDTWFKNIPSDWLKIATLHLNQPLKSSASNYVSFYAVDTASADKMTRVLQEYAKQYPSEYHGIQFKNPIINN